MMTLFRAAHVLLICMTLLDKLQSYTINSEFSNWIGCISYHEIKPILDYKGKVLTSHQPVEFMTSIDLGLSVSKIYLDSEGLHSEKKELLATWTELETIYEKKNGCYALYDDGSKPWHITTISKSSSIPASLCPPLSESGAPTMVLGWLGLCYYHHYLIRQ